MHLHTGNLGVGEASDPFATAFSPTDYLRTYFVDVMADERAALEWLATVGRAECRSLRRDLDVDLIPLLIDVGSGPTVHRLFPLADLFRHIWIGDYLHGNLAEVRRWMHRHDDGHDWSPFSQHVQKLLGGPLGAAAALEHRARERIVRLVSLDLRRRARLADLHAVHSHDDAVDHTHAHVVTSFFCADSATHDRAEFAVMIGNLSEFVAPRGLFLGGFLGGCAGYRVGEAVLPSASLTDADVTAALLASGLTITSFIRCDVPELADEGFDHIFLVAARRSAR